MASSGRGDVLIRTGVDPGPGSGFSVGTASASATDGKSLLAIDGTATVENNGSGNTLVAVCGSATFKNGDAQVAVNPLSPKSA